MASSPTITAAAAEESPLTFHVKRTNEGKKFTFTLPFSTSIQALKTKLVDTESAGIPEEHQRLIFSGRLLKNEDTLASLKLRDGFTILLVGGVPNSSHVHPSATENAGPSLPQSPVIPSCFDEGVALELEAITRLDLDDEPDHDDWHANALDIEDRRPANEAVEAWRPFPFHDDDVFIVARYSERVVVDRSNPASSVLTLKS